MAKKIIYSIEIDSTDAQGSIKRVEERLNELNQSANASQKEINTLQQELKELGQTNTNGAVQGVQSLRREYRRLVEELQQTEEGTEAFNRLAQEAGRVKDRIDAAQDSVNNFNKSPFENILGNFRQLRQRIFDLDFDGFNQSLRDLRTNLGNAATEFIGIQRGAGLAANGLKIFKVALAATGIGLLVAAVATLIAKFDTIKESGGLIGNTFKSISNTVESFTTSVLKLSDALGLTNEAYQKYIASKKEGTEANKKEVGSLEELEEAEFNARKQKGLTTAAEEEAFRLRKISQTQLKSEKELQQELNELKEKEVSINKEIKDISTANGAAFVNDAKELYAELNSEQKDFVDKQVAQYVRIKDEGGSALDAFFKEFAQTFEELDAFGISLIDVNLLVRRLGEIEIKSRELDEVDKKRIETQNRLTLVQKIAAAERIKSLNETLAQDLDNAEKRKNIQLDALNRRFLQELETEESFNREKEDIEQAFLSEKLRLNVKAGKDISAIQVQISDNLVKFEQQRLQDLKDFVDKAFSQTIEVSVSPFTTEEKRPEDVKNANEKIGLLEKEVQVRQSLNNAQLESPEIPNLEQSILLNDAKLKVLEDYGLKDSELYRDAINEKMILEAELTRAINDENKKRLDNEAQTLENRKKENIQYANQILSSVGGLTNQIQAFTNQRYDNEIQRAGENQQEINRIAKEQFETNKAFGIVSSIINTSMAIMNIWANTPNPIAAGILTGVVAAIGAYEIATIASQEFQPGTSAGTSFTPNQQGSQSLGSVSAMQPNVNFAAAGSGANIQTAGGGSPQSVQFTGSISVSEINNTQQLVNVYETGSLLGGG
jgi:hypothetical protein